MILDVKTLLNAGVHFGHLTRKRHPNMAQYIFMEKILKLRYLNFLFGDRLMKAFLSYKENTKLPKN